ncbi:MAG: alpha-2-macroglobulin [Gammaproteobacteria bacterium]
MNKVKILFSFFLIIVFKLTPAFSAEELKILRITPQGDNIPAGQQIVIEFDQAVVHLGNMQRDSEQLPISISPQLNCQWRWMDTRSLVCQLDAEEKLSLATKYAIKIETGITTENGVGMDSSYDHTFRTELPDIRSTWFRTWATPGTPVIHTEFNMPVTKASVEKHLFLETGDQRFSIKAEIDPNLETEKNSDPDLQQVWLISPEEELPLDSSIKLMTEAGLVSDQGISLSQSNRTVVEFQTFPEFEFIGVRCFSAEHQKQILISESNGLPSCDPQGSITLSFSAPVAEHTIRDNLVIEPDLANGRKDYDPWAGHYFYSRLSSPHQKDQNYDVYLPENLKAFHPYIFSSKDIRDEFNRPLISPVDLKFFTSHRQPNLNLSHPMAVLEKNVDSQLPVYITNLNKLDLNYSLLSANKITKDTQEKLLDVPNVVDVAFAHPLPIREILNHKSGVISGHLSMQPNPRGYNPDNFFVQVTPWQVHVKLGHFNSLVWVVDMATGLPVPNADISIYAGSMDLKEPNEIIENVITNDQGLAEFSGLLTLDPNLELINSWEYNAAKLMIKVEKDQDIALLPATNSFTVWGRNVYPWNRDQFGYLKAWGTTAQGVYRPGDTIQYKLYVRDQNNQTLIKSSLNSPDTSWSLTITDPKDKVVTEIKDLKLNEFGAYDNELLIPKNASVGSYRFTLKAEKKIDQKNQSKKIIFQSDPLTVLVSDFTPAPFKIKTELNGKTFQPGDQLTVSTTARLHAGGPYTQAQTSISADLIAGSFSSRNPVAKGMQFDTRSKNGFQSEVIFQKQELLDDKGDLETTFDLIDKNIIYGTLRVESRVQDDRGKNVANLSTAKFFARDQLVGLKNSQWVYQEDQPAEINYMVVDQKGNPIANTAVSLIIERQETNAARVKSAGNAYTTRYITEWVPTAFCTGVSSIELAACVFTPGEAGYYRIKANIKDSQKREHSTQIYAWVVGKGQVLWEQPSNNNLSIIPENTDPKIGDTVRYLVKNPYPGGKALITVERYGILKSWVEDFDDSTEIVEFEVEPDFMPGFYLSVNVFSPRVEPPEISKDEKGNIKPGQVDLGKPAFSMGYVSVPVSDPYKQLDVTIESNKETYKPGENIELSFSAQPENLDQDNQKQDVELAIVVLDEAVFDLIKQGDKYFDPYKSFYSLESLDVANFSLLTRLIGRQNFEKKGANPGGDGRGSDNVSFRSIDKYVGYWNPSLILQPDQKQTISFTAPDNLTGWRVFAMAVNKTDRLGLGKGEFKVNKEIELRPVMPNQVMQGDQFQAGFSVLNRTDKTKEINVEIKVSGDDFNDPDQSNSVGKYLTVEPFKRETFWLPVKTKSPGEIVLTAQARSGSETDGLMHTVPVLKRRIFDTAAEYGTFTEQKETTSILFPEKIHSDSGSLSINVSSTVISNVGGAFNYMRDYPYWCWEQRLSKGVMADHFQNLKDYMPDNLDWNDSEKLAEKMINDATNFQAPNGGMAFWIPKDEYVSPYLSAYTAIAFNWLRKSGHNISDQIEEKLHRYLTELLKRDVMPSFYDKGMASTVRAVALAALSKQGKTQLTDLERFREHVPQMSLFGKAHYLIAANNTHGAENIITEITHKILSHGVQSAGKFQFNESLSSDYNRILATPMRTQCSILSALTETAQTTAGKNLVGDIPFKIVRSITQGRGARDHWQNTQENMFCMNALSEYSRVYEAESTNMIIKTTLNDELFGVSKFKNKRSTEMSFVHMINKNDSGRKATVTLEKEGSGRVYYTTRMQYALLDSEAERVNSGMEIRREYSIKRNDKWERLNTSKDNTSQAAMQIKRGDLVRIDLFVNLPTTRNYVVIDDPVPGGLEPVNRDLATTSVFDAEAGEFEASGDSFWFERDDWKGYSSSRWSFYHQEMRHDSVRFYSDYLSPGNYHLSYTAQAIATGTFSVLPAKTEEMYDPDIYGRSLPATLEVTD